MAEEMESIETILSNLQEYREQIEQVEELLKVEPTNEEYLEMYRNLLEVRDMTEELLAAARSSTTEEADTGPSSAPPAARLAVGSECEAMWTADQPWCEAVVKEYTETGVQVEYVGYEGQPYELSLDQVRPRSQVIDVYQGVIAPKRLKVSEEVLPREVPKKYKITEADDEATRDKKRKQVKAFKSKVRLQQLDQETNERQGSWQSFMTGKGKKNKVGFLTGKKKESMFKSPDGDGKVGVTGSGKGLTKFTDRSRVDRLAE